jgi:Beta-ketoacyl synthase, N-terminal domain
MKLEFSIKSWTAWSSSKGATFSHPSSVYASTAEGEANSVNLTLIPAMKRRRMNHQCKMAISTALDSLKQIELEQPNCVFASQHGELGRSTKIIHSMIESGEISPTDFSMSVHNTALGLMSIMSKNQRPGTSIAAGDDTFGYGFLEACLQLQAEPNKPVLYVYFDEPLPEALDKFDSERAESRCIALVLYNERAGAQFDFSMSEPNRLENEVHIGTEGLDLFVKFCSSQQQRLNLNSSNHLWSWNRLK